MELEVRSLDLFFASCCPEAKEREIPFLRVFFFFKNPIIDVCVVQYYQGSLPGASLSGKLVRSKEC